MRLLVSALLALSLHYSIQAQFSFSDSAIRTRIKHDVYVLASDSLEGRKAGSEGEKKAYSYIIGRLEEAGIKPWGGKSYLQPFTREITGFTKPARLAQSGKSFIWMYDFGLCSCTSNDSVTSLSADGGFGLVIPAAGFDSYKDHPDIRGKIVLINLDAPENISKNKALTADLVPAARIANAIKKGAAGVILYNDQDLYKKMLFHFDQTDTVTVPVMYVTSEVIEFIRHHSNGPITMVPNLARSLKTYNNITGYIDNGASRTIVLGGHYDHLGKSMKPKYNGAYCVGADDNASGTAGILELARYYNTNKDPKNNYLIILFSAEEEGLLGSEYFVKQMQPALKDSINFMLNFDMIGRLGCQGMLVTAEATGSSPVWTKLYREVKHPDFHLDKVTSSMPFSDQDPFYLDGIPILYLNTGIHADYHTPADKPETLNYTGMVSILNYSKKLIGKAGSGEKVPYRKVPGISLYLEMTGFIFGYIGEMLSF